MRDYLDAIHSRVVLFDGGMGATLEQFDLTQEDYGGLQGKCQQGRRLHNPTARKADTSQHTLVHTRPDCNEVVHESIVQAGAEVLETATFHASPLKLDE